MGKSLHRFYIFVLNEWQILDKDVKLIAPYQFLNGAFKLPKCITRNISRVNNKGDSETMIQTLMEGYIMPHHIKVLSLLLLLLQLIEYTKRG
jgi:hypothetical protein